MTKRRAVASGLVCLVMACGVAIPTTTAQQKRLKVHISVDMEGIGGVVSSEQLGPSGFEYGRAREWMTGEALAAIAGAREAGATEIVVTDAHGNGQNLLIDLLPDDVRVIRSWPRPLMMMEGVDSSFAAAVFIAYHSGTANPAGVRAHTMSSASLAGVKVNGRELPEAGVNALIAGHFGVPVVFVSGDDAAVAETRSLVGEIDAVVVKRAISFHSANTMTPKASQAAIRAGVKGALERRAGRRPFTMPAPYALELTFKNYRPAEMLAYLPGARRVSSHSVRLEARNVPELSRLIEFVMTYQPDLAP